MRFRRGRRSFRGRRVVRRVFAGRRGYGRRRRGSGGRALRIGYRM